MGVDRDVELGGFISFWDAFRALGLRRYWNSCLGRFSWPVAGFAETLSSTKTTVLKDFVKACTTKTCGVGGHPTRSVVNIQVSECVRNLCCFGSGRPSLNAFTGWKGIFDSVGLYRENFEHCCKTQLSAS